MVFTKRFVSVYINPAKLQVVLLSHDKKRVQKFLSLDLPQGLIENSRITNIVALSEALSTVWKKLGIKEKTVSVVIPEFSSLIKTFLLPKLEDSDLDEAVRWHSIDYLPSDAKKFILDWKVAGEEADKYQIITAALSQEVLDSYILAFEKAGLIPIKVDIPSLTLNEIISPSTKGRIIVYQAPLETTLILTSGAKVVGSSVITPKTLNDLTLTIKRMLKYYAQVKVDEIFFGGSVNAAEFVKEVKTTFGIEAAQFSIAVAGMSKEQVQEYLIAISSQLKDAYEPSDKNTINLLPPPLVQKYLRARLRLNIWTLTLFVTLFIWFSFMSTFIVYSYLGNQLSNSYQSANVGGLPQEQAKILETVKAINGISQKVINIKAGSYSPATVLNQIYVAKPEGISLNEYFIDFETGDIRVLGVSASRVSLIDFKYKLEENGDFSLVAIPISSFENDKDFEFEMNFAYLPIKSRLQIKKTK